MKIRTLLAYAVGIVNCIGVSAHASDAIRIGDYGRYRTYDADGALRFELTRTVIREEAPGIFTLETITKHGPELSSTTRLIRANSAAQCRARVEACENPEEIATAFGTLKGCREETPEYVKHFADVPFCSVRTVYTDGSRSEMIEFGIGRASGSDAR